MTVAIQTNSNTYTGTATVGPFAYGFKIWLDDDLEVFKTLIATGVETPLTLNTNYTVTGAGDDAGGSVTLLAALAATYTITIRRAMDYLQSVDFSANTSLSFTALENALDKQTMMIQQVNEKADRALVSAASTSPVTFASITGAATSNPSLNSSLTSKAGLGANTFTSKQTLATSALAAAPINMPPGVAPTSPVAGDLWPTTSGLFYRCGTTTVGPMIDASVGAFSSLTGDCTSNASLNTTLAGKLATSAVGTMAAQMATNVAITGGNIDGTDIGINTVGNIKYAFCFADQEYNAGNSGTSKAINWAIGNHQRLTLTATSTLSFSLAGGVGPVQLKLIQGGTGSYTVTWPATVKHPASTAPVLSTSVGATDIVGFYFDGTNYHRTLAVLNSG